MNKKIKKRKRHKENILRLRQEGKTYTQIEKELGCSRSVICYHCGNGNEKKRLQANGKKRSILQKKVSSFKCASPRHTLRVKLKGFKKRNSSDGKNSCLVNNICKNYSVKDVLKKIGLNPICYLTGKKINIDDGGSYHLDHVIPTAKDGTNDLDNLNICIAEANMAKGRLSLEEFYKLCEDVIKWRDACEMNRTRKNI